MLEIGYWKSVSFLCFQCSTIRAAHLPRLRLDIVHLPFIGIAYTLVHCCTRISRRDKFWGMKRKLLVFKSCNAPVEKIFA